MNLICGKRKKEIAKGKRRKTNRRKKGNLFLLERNRETKKQKGN